MNFSTVRLVVLGVCSSLILGCSSVTTSNTARTATEQLLISNAIDQSLDKIDFRYFAGHSVYLEEKYVDCTDKAYLIASVRHRVLHNGASLVEKVEEADVKLELRAGSVGTTTAQAYIGTPQIVLPGMLTLPEVKIWNRNQQTGTAKLGLVAIDPKSGRAVGHGGVALAKSDDSNWFLAGVGPFQNGSVRKEVETSTTGAAAQSRDRLPHQVVFGPVKSRREDGVQTASDEEIETTPAKPTGMRKRSGAGN